MQQPLPRSRTTISSSSSPTPHPELQSLQAQLQQTQLAYHMAQEMSQFKGTFLARISHELRSPLNSLIGLHQLILGELCENPEEEREFIAQAHESALKMMHLLDWILEVSKAEHGSEAMEVEPVQLEQLFQEVHQLTYLQARDRNLHLHIAFPEPSVYVLADFRRLRQVIVNLIDTAIASMSDGSLHLSCHLDSEHSETQIWLEDERPITDWTQPTTHTPHAKPPSAGLTLAVNQSLLELMQGRLELVNLANPSDSNPGATHSGEKKARWDQDFTFIPLTRIQCSLPSASSAIPGSKPTLLD